MSQTLTKLQERHTKLLNEQRSYLDGLGADDVSAESTETIERFDTDLDALEQRISQVRKAEERQADTGTTAVRDAVTDSVNQAEARADYDDVDAQVRDFFAGNRRSLTIKAPTRDQVKGTDSAGGYTVQTSFYDQLVEHMIESSAVLRAGATILRTTSGEDIQIPTTTTHPTAALIAEGAAITESDAVFAQRTLGAYKYAVLNQVSSELIADTSVDMLGYLARACGRAVGNAFGVHAITGDGSSKPTGMQTSAATGVTGGAGVTGAFTADDMIDLYYSVIEPYRDDPSCAYLMRDASMATMRKLKDDNNQYLWSPATETGKPSTFMGKPVYTDPNVPAIALGADSVLFGAMSAYFVRQVNDIRFERSDDYAFANDLVTFRCIVRMDGITVDQTGAIKAFTGNAA